MSVVNNVLLVLLWSHLNDTPYPNKKPPMLVTVPRKMASMPHSAPLILIALFVQSAQHLSSRSSIERESLLIPAQHLVVQSCAI